MTFPAKPPSPQSQRMRIGAVKVLLVMDSAQLVMRMSEVLRNLPGTQLAGTFTTATETLDWLAWEKPNWHLAYVDMSLTRGSSEEVVRGLFSTPHPGTVVGVCDHLWRELRQKCAGLGVHTIIEKGDLVAFQDDVERRLR